VPESAHFWSNSGLLKLGDLILSLALQELETYLEESLLKKVKITWNEVLSHFSQTSSRPSSLTPKDRKLAGKL
jgi:CubicO group peptidase (beta-lactamase class C family)